LLTTLSLGVAPAISGVVNDFRDIRVEGDRVASVQNRARRFRGKACRGPWQRTGPRMTTNLNAAGGPAQTIDNLIDGGNRLMRAIAEIAPSRSKRGRAGAE